MIIPSPPFHGPSWRPYSRDGLTWSRRNGRSACSGDPLAAGQTRARGGRLGRARGTRVGPV